eukprot:3154927-Amphidinium_carterae.2
MYASFSTFIAYAASQKGLGHGMSLSYGGLSVHMVVLASPTDLPLLLPLRAVGYVDKGSQCREVFDRKQIISNPECTDAPLFHSLLPHIVSKTHTHIAE